MDEHEVVRRPGHHRQGRLVEGGNHSQAVLGQRGVPFLPPRTDGLGDPFRGVFLDELAGTRQFPQGVVREEFLKASPFRESERNVPVTPEDERLKAPEPG